MAFRKGRLRRRRRPPAAVACWLSNGDSAAFGGGGRRRRRRGLSLLRRLRSPPLARFLLSLPPSFPALPSNGSSATAWNWGRLREGLGENSLHLRSGPVEPPTKPRRRRRRSLFQRAWWRWQRPLKATRRRRKRRGAYLGKIRKKGARSLLPRRGSNFLNKFIHLYSIT